MYRCRWYIIKFEECNKYPTMKFRFWHEIITKNQGSTLGNIFPVRPSTVKNILQKNQTHVWNQDDISLASNRLVGPFQLGTTGKKKLKHLNIINEKQWKEL